MTCRAAIALGLLLPAALACAAPQPAPAIAEPVRLVVSPAASAHGDAIADAAIAVVMQHAGLAYTLTREPVGRALASFRAGLYDADMLRLPQFDQVAPGAIRVDPHLLSTTLLAFGRPGEAMPTSWAEVGTRRLAHVRGVKSIELALKERPNVSVTSGAEACLGMVAMARVDLCLLNAEHDYGTAPQVHGVTLQRSVLARVNLHIWVAPGQPALAQRLATAMRAALDSGELAHAAGGNRQP